MPRNHLEVSVLTRQVLNELTFPRAAEVFQEQLSQPLLRNIFTVIFHAEKILQISLGKLSFFMNIFSTHLYQLQYLGLQLVSITHSIHKEKSRIRIEDNNYKQ